MNVRLVSDFNLPEFKTLFPEITLLSNDDYNDETEIDLLIFPGGEDVTLSYYLDADDVRKFSPLCHTNRERDIRESAILENAIRGKLKVNKILGICRGMQFLNVKFGGNLYPDLRSYGIGHDSLHNIMHVTNSKLSFMRYVNSLHHQGCRFLGDYYTACDLITKPVTIALDEGGNVVEIASWLNGKVLGLQCHPEYYDDNFEDKIKFRETIINWVTGTKIIGER